MRTLRTTAALLALWFVTLGVAEGFGAFGCPHHLPIPPTSVPADHGAAGHDHDAGHEEHGPCTCVGMCHASATAAPAQGAEALPIVSAVVVAPRPPASRAPDATPRFLLPWPTGPPPSFALT